MYALKANFYPAEQKKMGYIGKADITVAGGLKLENISVFENPENNSRSLSFAKFGTPENEHSYVVPSSKEAYAAMLDVVSKAVDNEKHYAFEKGEYRLGLEVSGVRVDEPYADGRFSIAIKDFCSLNGICTREASYTRDGEKRDFVAVDFPAVRDAEGHVSLYTDEKGNQRANLQYEFLKHRYKDKDGKDAMIDYKALANNLIRKKRTELGKSLDATIGDAASKKAEPSKEKDAPAKEQDR